VSQVQDLHGRPCSVKGRTFCACFLNNAMKSDRGHCSRWQAAGDEKMYIICYYSCKGGDIVEYHSAKHKELSEQLATWWRTQTDFKTKKALAGFLKVHPDTLGSYFSGRKLPMSDIANRLCELTNIRCLKRDYDSDSSSEMVPQESSPGPMLLHPPGVAASIGEPQESDITWPSDRLKGGRHGERSVVISLQRTSCPFCGHDIARFRRCVYCGQDFVRANVPLESGEPM